MSITKAFLRKFKAVAANLFQLIIYTYLIVSRALAEVSKITCIRVSTSTKVFLKKSGTAKLIVDLKASQNYFEYFKSEIVNFLSLNINWSGFKTLFDYIS